MSSTPGSRSTDLARLIDEGYDITTNTGQLVLRGVPYVTSRRSVELGVLVSELTMAGSTTARPDSHVVYFVGEIPCDQYGRELENLIHDRNPVPLGDGLVAICGFSSKPSQGYADYYAKMTTYVSMLQGHAQALEPEVDACRAAPPGGSPASAGAVFLYPDTASGRARIGAATERLRHERVGIVGLGGTGSYVLDLVAKTPVAQIHLFDGDHLQAHNAFRAPGAASVEQLDGAPYKVDYFSEVYGRQRRGLHTHRHRVDADTVTELSDLSFVFLAIDNGADKKVAVTELERAGVAFIDVGMGLYEVDGALGGIARVTASVPDRRRHVWENGRISFGAAEPDEYDRNIQVADMNALNACLAVIKWKKIRGFYMDDVAELSTSYTVGANDLLNEDLPA